MNVRILYHFPALSSKKLNNITGVDLKIGDFQESGEGVSIYV